MRASVTGDTLTLSFSLLESRILRSTFRQIILNYQITPQNLDAKAASAWYSTRGCKAARMSAEETREWVENLHQVKSANVEQLVNWSKALNLSQAGARQMKIKLDQASILLTALNDHRLLLAATHDITQAEMDIRLFSSLTSLPPRRQMALSEIHFLAGMIEDILRFLPGNPPGWLEAL